MFDRLSASKKESNGELRLSGRPTSSNGASSFHAFWQLPEQARPEPLYEVSAVIEILQPPSVPRLHFWALQVSFLKAGQRIGAAHFGLQFHPGHPANGAVNWGGYRLDGTQLEGSTSALGSSLDNANSRDYQWQANRQYLYRIFKVPTSELRWRGSLTDLSSGKQTVIRDLYVDADSLDAPMVWTESFARCDDPSVVVRWSQPQAYTSAGRLLRPAAVKLGYQSHETGGCGNTNTLSDLSATALIQATNSERINPSGSRLAVAAPSG